MYKHACSILYMIGECILMNGMYIIYHTPTINKYCDPNHRLCIMYSCECNKWWYVRNFMFQNY